MRLLRRLLAPYRAAADLLLDAAEAILAKSRPIWLSAGAIFFATIASWWVYVPVHELLHAFGCRAAGGRVTELRIAPLYGGRLLSLVFPFVRAQGEYAGRLEGFDTGGSDLVYIATDLTPYLLSIAAAFPLLRRARLRRSALSFGAGAVLVAAPIMGLVGDYFEVAGILVSDGLVRLGAVRTAAAALRCDDLLALLADFPARFPAHRAAWAVVTGGTFLLAGLLVSLTLAAAWVGHRSLTVRHGHDGDG
jgi:hypothetical protein